MRYKRKHRVPTDGDNALAVFSFWVIVIGVIVAILLGGCTSEGDVSYTLEREAFGDDWPLVVDYAVVLCAYKPAMVVIHYSVSYAVNGTARGMAQAQGWRDIDEIWADNPAGPSPKKSLVPLMDAWRAACEG